MSAVIHPLSAHELRAQAWVAERFFMSGSAKYLHSWLTRVSVNARAASDAAARAQVRSPIDSPREQARVNALRQHALQAEALCQALQRGSRHVHECEVLLQAARSAAGRAAKLRPVWLRWLPQRRGEAAMRLAVMTRSQSAANAVRHLQLIADRAAELLQRPSIRPYWEPQEPEESVFQATRPQTRALPALRLVTESWR